jgi:hypothetical protein
MNALLSAKKPRVVDDVPELFFCKKKHVCHTISGLLITFGPAQCEI